MPLLPLQEKNAMETPTFEQLPLAVTKLHAKLEEIERLLLLNGPQNQSEQDKWFDLSELCAYLPDKPAKGTVYGWVHQSIIPNHKKSKKLSFRKSEIDAWLKSGRRFTGKEIDNAANEFLNSKKLRK